MDVLTIAFSGFNIVYSVFLILILLYWMTVFIGLLDMSSFDVDMDLDADVDMDLDVDVDADVDVDVDADVEVEKEIAIDGAGGASVFLTFLSFLNFGKVPFMVLMSFLALSMWSFAMAEAQYLGITSFQWSAIFFVPNLVVGFLVTKIVTQPLKPIFKEEENEFKTHKDIIGKTGEVILKTDDQNLGQVEIEGKQLGKILITVKADKGYSLQNGDQALVIAYEEEDNYYVVTPFG